MTVADRDRLEQRLDWLRYVESMDEISARRQLRARLRSDSARARAELRSLDRWPSMTTVVEDMLARDAEVVRLQRIVEAVPVGTRILDVGCGPGVVGGTLALHERPAGYLGIDLSEPKIAAARDMATTNGLEQMLRFEVGDATSLPTEQIDELQPDVVLILEVLEHLQDPTTVLSSIAAKLRDDTRIIFSVPILGRIEACWGHRTLYGADAIVGLADACGLEVLDVDEVHNTWALATACRRRTATDRPSDVRPIAIRHLTAPQLVAIDGVATVLTEPSRLTIAVEPHRRARIDATTPDADWIRVDVETSTPGQLRDAEIRTVDDAGRIVRRWVPDLTRSSEKGRSTIVARPGEASFVAADDPGPVSTTQVLLGTGEAATEVTVWRLGYAAGTSRLQRPPKDAPEQTARPWLARAERMIPAPAARALRRAVRRWPRLGKLFERLRRR